MYYISCTLVGYEINYSSIEQACLVVVFAKQKIVTLHVISYNQVNCKDQSPKVFTQ